MAKGGRPITTFYLPTVFKAKIQTTPPPHTLQNHLQ